MTMHKKMVLAGIGAWLVVAVHAADVSKPVASVNGVKLGSELMDVMLSTALAQGATDGAELRSQLRNEMVAREVLAPEARAGWDYVLVAKPNATVSRDYGLLQADLRSAIALVHKDRT